LTPRTPPHSLVTTLIYDKDVSGHHLDYLQFLIEYLSKMPASVRAFFVFVLNEAAESHFEQYAPLLRFHYMAPSQIAFFDNQPTVLKRAAVEFKYMRHLGQQYQAKRLFFMHIDAFQLELGKAQYWHTGVKIAGILFLPFRKQYEDGTTPLAWLKRALRGQRKHGQVAWMLANPELEHIFFLNDQEGVAQYNQRFGERFAYLPDPIDQNLTIDQPVEALKLAYGVPPARTVFLIYGHLSARKNMPNIMAALGQLPAHQRAKTCALICGEPEKGYENTLHAAIEAAKQQCPEVVFVTHYRFFDPVATNEVFKLTNVVLVPYIDFFSSSNILGLAAKYHKPLIASKLGVMGRLVKQYQLGQTVNPASKTEIGQAIEAHLANTAPTIDGTAYLKAHTTAVFCQKILNL